MGFFNQFIYKYFNEEACVVLGLLSVLIMAFYFLGDILTPIIVSIVLVYVLNKATQAFSSRFNLSHRISCWIMSGIFVCAVLLAIFYLIPLFVHQITTFGADWPNILKNSKSSVQNLLTQNLGLQEDQASSIMRYSYDYLIGASKQVITNLSGSLSNVVTISIYSVIIPILVLFILPSWKKWANNIGDMFPSRYSAIHEIFKDMGRQISHYTNGKIFEMTLVSIVSYITFYYFGLNYAGILAVMSGISVLIPIVGVFIVTIPIVLIAILQWDLSHTTMYLLIVHISIQLLDGYVVVPFIFSGSISSSNSGSINVHPAATIICILIFGGMWGVWGAFFAIPIYTLLRALIKFWPIVK